MSEKSVTTKKLAQGSRLFAPYRVDSHKGRWCQRPLSIGSRVRTGTLIGHDLATDKPIRASGRGRVVGLSFLGGQFVVDVFIEPEGRSGWHR